MRKGRCSIYLSLSLPLSRKRTCVSCREKQRKGIIHEIKDRKNKA